MELDIHGVQGGGTPVHEVIQRLTQTDAEAKKITREAAKKFSKDTADARGSQNSEQYIKEILNFTQFFNKRLRFTVNEELDQVVVKVVDVETDKVIREIPPEVLQRMHVRIREAIGLLFDETI